MKNLIHCFLYVFFTLVAHSQSFNYQSIVRNASGNPQVSTTVYLRFTILETETSGVILYREIQNPTTDQYGWLSVAVGKGTPVSGIFSSVDFSVKRFLLVECSNNGGGSYAQIGISQINPLSPGMKGDMGATGPKGDQGIQGIAGPKGDKGDQGNAGATGPKGDQGASGVAGSKGDKGDTGPKGDKGDAGSGVKIVGSLPAASALPLPYTGVIGDMYITQNDGNGHVWSGIIWTNVGQIKGPKGDQGATGLAGPKGDKGDTGNTGATGPKGDQGTSGLAGSKGDKGDQGATGLAGPKGDKGDAGNTGATGPKGDEGTSGIAGTAGAKGDKGDQGVAGVAGPKGDKGDTGNTGATGPKGDTGLTGPKGDTGSAGTYSAGAGIIIAANAITNIGDINASDDITTSSTAGGKISGPFSNLTLNPNSVDSPQLANMGATNNQVLTYNGTAWQPRNPSGFTLPYTSNYGGVSTAFQLNVQTNQTGLEINNIALAGATKPAIAASSNGTSTMEIEGNSTNTFSAVARFHNDNPSGNGVVLSAESAGKAIALTAHSVSGKAAIFDGQTNTDTSVVQMLNLGKGPTLEVLHSNPTSTDNAMRINTSTRGSALKITIANTQNLPANALELQNGFIKVNQNAPTKTAYVHTTNAQNTFSNYTNLGYLGMSSTDILFVTRVYQSRYINSAVGVWWDGQQWNIYREDLAAMPIGEKFNILVIKQ